MRGVKFSCRVTFDINNVDRLQPGDRNDLRTFIKDALESWGGQRHPDDWLFDSLERVQIGAIELDAKE